MKAFIKLCALIVIFSMLCIPIAASSIPAKNAYTTDDGEIYFNNDCSDIVANKVVNAFSGAELSSGAPSISPMANLLCIFGHSLETGSFYIVTHYAKDNTPRCLNELYCYEVCTRAGCEYAVYTFIASGYIYCH